MLAHPLSVPFGDLVFQNLDMFAEGPDVGPEIADLDGLSVREVLAEADLVLGGDTATPFTVDDMGELLEAANMSFDSGLVSTFAMEHLAFPATARRPGALDLGDAADRLRRPLLHQLSGVAKRQGDRAALD